MVSFDITLKNCKPFTDSSSKPLNNITSMHSAAPTVQRDPQEEDICSVYEIPDEILGQLSEDPQRSPMYESLKERNKEPPTAY